jgi:hypothetical protein
MSELTPEGGSPGGMPGMWLVLATPLSVSLWSRHCDDCDESIARPLRSPAAAAAAEEDGCFGKKWSRREDGKGGVGLRKLEWLMILRQLAFQ